MSTYEIIKQLVDQANQNGVEVELRNQYSGCGMYGGECVGIVCDDIMDVMVDLPIVFAEEFKKTQYTNVGTAIDDFAQQLSELQYELSDYCQDNMGLSKVYYWKNIESEEEIEEETEV